MSWIQRFMYGRYGWDQFNLFLLLFTLFLYLVDIFVDFFLFDLLYFLCVLFALYRMFSRNYTRRRAENAKFMSLAGPVVRWWKLQLTIRRDKEHRYFKCPNCGQQLRVPRGKGKLTITCRNCGVSFEEKT